MTDIENEFTKQMGYSSLVDEPLVELPVVKEDNVDWNNDTDSNHAFLDDARESLNTLMEELFVGELRLSIQSVGNKTKTLEEDLKKRLKAIEGKLNALQSKLTKDLDGSLYDELTLVKEEILSESKSQQESFANVVHEIDTGLNEVSASLSTTVEQWSQSSSLMQSSIEKQVNEIQEGLANLTDHIQSLDKKRRNTNVMYITATIILLMVMLIVLYKVF